MTHMNEEAKQWFREQDGAWIGVDLDGTLATYEPGNWQGSMIIGDPVQPMVQRIKDWLSEGYVVKIFTARVAEHVDTSEPEECTVEEVRENIQNWLEDVAGLPRLEVTNVKDWKMLELWDDRAVTVQMNTGQILGVTSFT